MEFRFVVKVIAEGLPKELKRIIDRACFNSHKTSNESIPSKPAEPTKEETDIDDKKQMELNHLNQMRQINKRQIMQIIRKQNPIY